MLLITSVDGEGVIGVTDEFAVTIKAYVREDFKKVWKIIFVRKEFGEDTNYVALMDDVVSVQFRRYSVIVQSAMDGNFSFFPSESLNVKQLKKIMRSMISEGMPRRKTVPDYEGEGLPPYVEWKVDGNYVDLPLDRVVLVKASQLLEAELNLTPVPMMKQVIEPPERRRKRRRRNDAPVNTTSVSSDDFADVVYGILYEYEKGAADYQQALGELKTQAEDFIRLMPQEEPLYVLGDTFENASGQYAIISGGRLAPEGAAGNGSFFYDLIDTKKNLRRHSESEIRLLFGEPSEMDSEVSVFQFGIPTLQLRNLIARAQNLRKLIRAKKFNSGKIVPEFARSENPDEDEAERENKENFDRAYWERDQKKRASAAYWLGDIDDDDPNAAANQNQVKITAEAYAWSKLHDRNVCTICLSGFTAEDEVNEYPVKLKCGHFFHYTCIKRYQQPNFADGSYLGLKARDTLLCPNCKTPALDNKFGDGVYRYVNLRF